MNTEETLRTLLQLHERERQLVAYDIHDGLAQYVSAAIMHLEAHEAAIPQNLCGNSHINEVLRLLRQASSEARHLIAGLRPPALDELSIVDAINALVTDAHWKIPEVTFSSTGDCDRLSAQAKTALFRIAQESLTNIRRHATATKVLIKLTLQPAGAAMLQITDNGRGFDPSTVTAEHLGLEGIRQRANVLGGTATVISQPNEGTTLKVSLPATVN